MFWKEGIGEWQSVRNSAPKENGYHWSRKPLWGYQNEADPAVMREQIEQAVKHGVNVFIYDWYDVPSLKIDSMTPSHKTALGGSCGLQFVRYVYKRSARVKY
jgi:hypothetical protein